MSAAFDAVRKVIHSYPVIDNHCHNLLREEHADVYPFESVTSEASGQALKGVHSQLSHVRATRQLQQLYGSQNGDWDSILDARKRARKSNPQQLLGEIFQKTHCLLIDDGLDATYVHSYHWHSRLTPAPAKRIVRIESVAETIVNTRPSVYEEDVRDAAGVMRVFSAFQGSFKYRMKQCIEDPEVAGFKSVVCYRSPTSLDVSARPPDLDRVAEAFVAHVFSLGSREQGKKSRLSSKLLNEWLLHETLGLIRDFRPDRVHRKPLQLHTGLGDADIRLLQSNPAYLQPLIEAYPMVPFVLLHSAYPYTREAGYLATVYSNVFLDLGEIFPTVSRSGQISVLRQSLELTPVHKLLYSSDGHFFAETFHLAEIQFREALEVVVRELMESGELDGDQAKNLVQSILFENSNQLYRLGLSLSAGLTAAAPRSSLDSLDTKPTATTTFPIMKVPSMTNIASPRVDIHDTDYVHIQWSDCLGQIRSRVLPQAAFSRLVASNGKIGITQGAFGILQNDTLTSAFDPAGMVGVKPDLSSLRSAVSAPDEHSGVQVTVATCMANFVSASNEPLPFCPRTALRRIVDSLKNEYGLTPKMGFEIEVIFFKDDHQSEPTAATSRGWSTFTPSHHAMLPMVHAISTQLAAMGAPLEQWHAESAPGQLEFVLPPFPPVEAVDLLIQARQVIRQLARQYGYRATFHPHPVDGSMSASHTHISLGERAQKTEFDFWGGVLARLPALCALSLAGQASYARVAANSWTGGEWVAWGTQNREVPLRRIPSGSVGAAEGTGRGARWELRCLDGLANVYLAAAAVLGAGLLGLRDGLGLRGMQDLTVNPATLDEMELRRRGVTRRLPRSLDEALGELQADLDSASSESNGARAKNGGLAALLGRRLVSDYLVLKRAETKMLEAMGEAEARRFMVERY